MSRRGVFGCYEGLEECQGISVIGCFKYYHSSSTKGHEVANCDKSQFPFCTRQEVITWHR